MARERRTSSHNYFYYIVLKLTVHHFNQQLKTIEGRIHNTFQEACLALNLLQDDTEWENCLKEAATFMTAKQLRNFYMTIAYLKNG